VYHGPFYLRFVDGAGEAEAFTQQFLARDYTDVHCAVFNFEGPSDDPVNRASVLVHEAWHHWQYHKGFEGDHPTGGDIESGLEGDYYYHQVGDFDFGVLWQYQLDPLRFHSPYQVQCEFDADIAEFSFGWIPVAVTQSARQFGNTRLVKQFFNRPPTGLGSLAPSEGTVPRLGISPRRPNGSAWRASRATARDRRDCKADSTGRSFVQYTSRSRPTTTCPE
jgi:hypothetical protein